MNRSIRILLLISFGFYSLFGHGAGAQGQAQEPAPTAAYRLQIVTQPEGGIIYINGSMADTTAVTQTLRAGQHTIRVEKDGYKTWEETIVLAADQTLEVILKRKRRMLLWIVLAVVTGGVATAFALKGDDDDTPSGVLSPNALTPPNP
jgi:hypothetical protein